ncbi:MAG: short chain dehydrogenase [Bdellovibrionota bacterium]
MKILLVGANGAVGKHVKNVMSEAGHEVISIGKKSGDFQMNIEDASSIESVYKRIGSFDAVAIAAGDVAFAPLAALSSEQWGTSLQSKLMGQIKLVQQALPYINEKGSFTLISGILGEEFILGGAIASTVNSAIEGFAQAAAFELPKGLRINVVSPTLLKDSVGTYGPYFPGFLPVDGEKVAQAFKKSIMGIQTGTIYRVH